MDEANKETLVATIEKGRTQDIRVRLVEFHGKTYVDIRMFVVTDATEGVPTKKGIAVPPALLPELIAALQYAEREARAAGLIGNEGKEAA